MFDFLPPVPDQVCYGTLFDGGEVDDPALVPQQPLFLVPQPLQQTDHSDVSVVFSECFLCFCGELTTAVTTKQRQSRLSGRPMASLVAGVIGQSPQSAGQVEQSSASSQTPSPHTGAQSKGLGCYWFRERERERVV